MPTKIVFFLGLLLITTFSNFTLCIQNGGAVRDGEERHPLNTIKFSADDAFVPIAESKIGTAEESGLNPADNEQQAFNNYGQYTVEIIRIPPKRLKTKKYAQQNVASRQRGTSSHAAFNTGEYYQTANDYYNEAPSSSNYRPYSEQYASNTFNRDNTVPNYQSYNDNPNYFQDNNYAHNYNYPGNKRPNYNPRPTPPPPPQSRPDSSYPYDYPYQQQHHQTGRPTSPYPYPYPSFNPNQQQQQSSYDYPSYASLFNNFQAFSNPLTSLFSGFGGIGKPANPLGSQLTKALENIAANDDLNCVPKLLCQMVGNPERRADLPSFLTAPAITSLIAALPATSPVLTFGRAALLGFTGGEQSCDSMYSKCPQNEDDLLYYLNNHRGGFFRFFNGGGEFSEVSSNFQTPQSQHTGSRPQSTYSSDHSNQGTLQSFLGSSGSTGLEILGSFASLFLPSAPSSNSGSYGLVSMVGNLLGGLMGGQRKKRKLTKRSIEDVITSLEERSLDLSNTTANTEDESVEHKDVDNSNSERKARSSNEDVDLHGEEIEGRILNYKGRIFSNTNADGPSVKFPFDDGGETNYADGFRYGKGVNFDDSKYQDTYIKYPPYNDVDDKPYRPGKKINFNNDNDQDSNIRYTTQDYNRYEGDNDRPYRLKMIFPDRTGTGNLRFDNSDFDRDRERDRDRDQDRDRDRNRDYNRDYDRNSDRDRDRDRDHDRDRNRDYDRDRYPNYNRESDPNYNRDRYPVKYGKILTKPSYSKYQNYYDYDETYNKRKPYYPSNSQNNDYTNSNRYDYTTTRRPYYNRYETTTRRPNYNDDYYGTYQHTNRYTSSLSGSRPSGGGEGNIYVTNSQGVVDHYIKPNGQKVYV